MSYGNYAPFYRGGFFNPLQTPQMSNIADGQSQFAQPYQAPMQPTQINSTPMSIPNQQTNDMIWVLNENEATSYPVAPNNSVVLWDKSNPTIYVKSVNAQGVPSMRILDFAERMENTTQMHGNTQKAHTCDCGKNFVPITEFNALKEQVEELKSLNERITDLQSKYESLLEKPKPKTTKAKENTDNE